MITALWSLAAVDRDAANSAVFHLLILCFLVFHGAEVI